MKLIDKIVGEIIEGPKKEIKEELEYRVNKYESKGAFGGRYYHIGDEIKCKVKFEDNTYIIERNN